MEYGINRNLKADLETPLFELPHLYFQTNSFPLGKHLCLCAHFLDIRTPWLLFIWPILKESALNGRNSILFLLLQKLKVPARIQNSDFKQQQKYPLAQSKTQEILNQKTVPVSLHSQS